MAEHRWEYCNNCQTWMVVCGECGNNTCNGGYGPDGKGTCTSCPQAYSLAELYHTTKHTINWDELTGLGMTDCEYKDRLKAIVPIPTSLKLAQLDAKIAAYEAKMGLSSEEMMAKVSSGELDETEEMCDWLLDLDLRGRLRNLG